MKNDSLVAHIGKNLIVVYGDQDQISLPGSDLLDKKDLEIIRDELKLRRVVLYGFRTVDDEVPPPGFEKLSKENLEQLAYLLTCAGQRSLMGDMSYKTRAVMSDAFGLDVDFIPSLMNALTTIQAMHKG